MTHPLVLYLSRRDNLSADEIAALESLTIQTQSFAAGSSMIVQGTSPKHSLLMLDGLSVRAHILKDGKRMISALHLPGDFVDLHSLLLDVMDHDVAAITDCRVALAPHAELRRITETMPHLGRMLWLSTIIDAAVHRAWIVSLGRMSPLSHLAHILCELYTRMRVIGLVADEAFRLPITQTDLSDILGLSVVHVSRTLQELRATGLMTWVGQTVTIRDWDGMVRLAQFDPTYLNLRRTPR